MKNILEDLVKIDKKKSSEILNQMALSHKVVQLKAADNNKVFNTQIKKKLLKTRYYLVDLFESIENDSEITIKIILGTSLYFLKTRVVKYNDVYYFEEYENLFELVRRKSDRFPIPDKWSQSAFMQAMAKNSLKSACKILDISQTGMKLKIMPQIPKYEKDQIVNLLFKVHRRGEIELTVRIVHLKKSSAGGPIVGVQFYKNSKLIVNKINNVYNDLAFYYVSQESL